MNINDEKVRCLIDVLCRYWAHAEPHLHVAMRDMAVPSISAVYFLLDDMGNISYIGQSGDLRRRLMRHAANGKFTWAEFSRLAYLELPDDRVTRLQVETCLVACVCPPRNSAILLRVSQKSRLTEIRWGISRRRSEKLDD